MAALPPPFQPRYEVARGICSIVSIIGLLVAALGLVLFFMTSVGVGSTAAGAIEYMVFAPSLGVIMAGLVNLALGEIGKALITNTNANLEIVELTKWQMKHSYKAAAE